MAIVACEVGVAGPEANPAHSGSEAPGRLWGVKWLGTFALATVVAGFGLLYEQVSDVRIGMERLHGELLREMSAHREGTQAEIAGLKDEMRSEFASVHREISAVRERVVRVETLVVGKGSPVTEAGSTDHR